MLNALVDQDHGEISDEGSDTYIVLEEDDEIMAENTVDEDTEYIECADGETQPLTQHRLRISSKTLN